MRLIMEYIGLALISVTVGGALLYTFVTAQDSGLTQVGAVAEQELADLNHLGCGQTYSKEEMDQQIIFSYEEKVYTAGVYEELAERFQAVTAGGKALPVKIDKAVSLSGEVLRGDERGIVFPEEGVYEVYVMAGGAVYKVTVPVAAADEQETAMVPVVGQSADTGLWAAKEDRECVM